MHDHILGHPAYSRLLTALFQQPCSRRDVDEITGNVNGPDVIYELRGRGWELPCERIQTLDRDNYPVQAGRYSMTPHDRQRWLELLAADQPVGAT